MNKYDGLLTNVADRYKIYKGSHESLNDWKTRLIYSVCGMMAYSSLWDDEDTPISMIHLKRRIRVILKNYKSMYPELSNSLPIFSAELENEITEQFLNTGIVYHCPNRIAPSIKHEEICDNVLFQRGIALDDISCVSGIGFYSKLHGTQNPDMVKIMFGLEHEDLQSLWSMKTSNASWQSNLPSDQNVEYLRLSPPFSHGYWINKPDTTGTISILRVGLQGSQLYYLYRYLDASIKISPLPQWQVESFNYRSLACACLLSLGVLPPIEYSEDGALVHIHINYLLPPHELAFLKLYSWPEKCTYLPCDFNRTLSTEVFTSIKNILASEGYIFKKEELPNANWSKFSS